MKTKAGFSLVEALVALVVLSLLLTSVWGWFGTATKSTRSIEQAVALPDVFSQFVVYLDLESLQEVRSGRYQILGYTVDWQAIINRQSDQEAYRRQPQWIVALFDIQASVKINDAEVTQFQTQLVKQWPDPNYVPPPIFN